jgi:hypothetical protein
MLRTCAQFDLTRASSVQPITCINADGGVSTVKSPPIWPKWYSTPLWVKLAVGAGLLGGGFLVYRKHKRKQLAT